MLTANVAVVAVAGTETDAGAVRAVLVLVRVTDAPPVGAGFERVTVQVLEAFGPRLLGLHASAETDTGGNVNVIATV